MSWDLVLRHCAVLRATLEQTRVSLELQASQLVALEAFAKQQRDREQAPQARIERPVTCSGYRDEECALLSEEAQNVLEGLGGAPTRIMCRGCGVTRPGTT